MEGDLYGSKKWWGRIGVIHSNHVGGDSPVCFKTKKAKVVNLDFLRALLFQVELFLFFSRNLFNITVLDDLAKQKPAWQSSMYEYNPASNAVDGKRLTTLAEGSCSHTNYEYSPWLTVDLRAKYKVTEVVITNRGDCCCEFICLSCCIYYRPQRSWGKVIFSQASVILSTGEGVSAPGGLLPGGVFSFGGAPGLGGAWSGSVCFWGGLVRGGSAPGGAWSGGVSAPGVPG